MNTTHRAARIAAALLAALVSWAIAAPFAFATTASGPRSAKARPAAMHWYRWHPTARLLHKHYGSKVAVGLASMLDFKSLRVEYGFGLGTAHELPALRAVLVKVSDAQLHSLLTRGAHDPRIRYVSPIGKKRNVLSVPNDPFLHTIDGQTNLPYEWPFLAAHVDRALEISSGDPKLVVGVIDTGIARVPDLAGKIDSLWTVTNGEAREVTDSNDDIGHGTAVASIIAANIDDAFGLAGFGGATHVIGVNASDDIWFFDAKVAIALNKLVALGARIVNMSLGGTTASEPILVDAIHQAAAQGVLLVASAGNDSHPAVTWPAADLQPSGGGRSYGISVGAVNAHGTRAPFSNWGRRLSVMASGEYGGICSGIVAALPPASWFDDRCNLTWIGDGGAHYGVIAGTSFAAPQVTGIAALVWAARPELKSYQVADIIKQSARRTATDWTPDLGCGTLDAGAALELATSRPASAWAATPNTDGAVCSALGDATATWPTEANQTVTFEPLPNRTLGEQDFTLDASATSGLPITFAAGGNCIVTGVTVHLTGAGYCTITASQAGDENFNPAAAVAHTFEIAPAPAMSVHASATSGRWGKIVALPFRIETGDIDVVARTVVLHRGAVVARLARGFFRAEPGRQYGSSWRAPRTRTTGAFRFCVTLVNRADETSAPDCKSIHLR